MKIFDILYETMDNCCELVYTDDSGEILSEAAIRQFKRDGQKITKKFRCTSGAKAGLLVSSPAACGTRKDPKKVRQGRKTMRQKQGVIARKSKISKSKAMSRIITAMNKRMMGNGQ